MSNAVLVCITVDMQSQLKWATIFWGWKHLMLRVSRFGSSRLRSFFTGSLLIFSDAIKQHCSIPCHNSGHEARALVLFSFGYCFYMRESVRGSMFGGEGGSTWGNCLLMSLSQFGGFPGASVEFGGIVPAVSPRIHSFVSLAAECELGEKLVFSFAHLFSLLLIFILCPWISLGTFHQRESNWGFSREFSLMESCNFLLVCIDLCAFGAHRVSNDL